jgi:AcrR family transcriptional regulator
VNKKESFLATVKGSFPEPCSFGLRRGRPRSMDESERRQLLICAAESVFLELGYGAAGTVDIARRAGMSKKTLYRLFDSKESLFAAVIAARRESMESEPIGHNDTTSMPAIERALCRYLGKLARFVLAPRQAALYRLVIAEAHRAPELSHAFYREGPEKAHAPLANWLNTLAARGILSISDPANAAAMLIAMSIAPLHMRLLMMGECRPIDEWTIDCCVGQAVSIFLRGAARAVTANKMAGQLRG